MPGADGARLLGFVEAFQGRTIVVLGDLVGDEYVYGKPDRISREAPVLILRYLSREVRLGGAANACHNLHTLGARVLPLGIVGADRAGEAVRRLFVEQGIPTEGVVTVGMDDLSSLFDSCTPAGVLDDRLGVDNEEQGRPVMVCRGPRLPWSALWPQLQHYD